MFSKKVQYSDLNPRQKEIYNFQKVSAAFAEYGYTTVKLSDDWKGADFIAISFDGSEDLRVQLKSTLVFDKKYIGKNLLVCFFERRGNEMKNLYVYPHDDLLVKFLPKIENTDAWRNDGRWFYPSLTVFAKKELEPYTIG